MPASWNHKGSMKKYILVFLIFLFTGSFLTSGIYAQTDAVVNETNETEDSAVNSEIQARRDRIQEKIQAKREEVSAKLEALRDDRIKRITTRIQGRINQINRVRTAHFLRVLDRLLAILAKIETRAEKLKEEGKDTSSVVQAISSAQSAVDNAEVVVETQKEKTYQIIVQSDNSAKDDIYAVKEQLRNDLLSVQASVKAARGSVHDALLQLVSL